MTRPEIEPRSSEPLENTLTIMPMSGFNYLKQTIKIAIHNFPVFGDHLTIKYIYIYIYIYIYQVIL